MSEREERVTCPGCGKSASGNFCQHCGTPLGGRFCNKCGAPYPEGDARFCNQCGSPKVVPGGSAGSAPAPSAASVPDRPAPPRKGGGASRVKGPPPAPASNLPWWIAGGALFGLIVVIGVTMVSPGPPPAPVPGGASAPAPAAGRAPDISNMTPREAADRLFNRVMESLSAGDTAGAMAFQPMGVQAYRRAEPLDLDGVYHLAMLELLDDPAAALETSERLLDAAPEHILGLAAAAMAADAAGRTDEAAGYFRRLLEAYPTEVERPLEEYQAHSGLLEVYRREAEAYLSGR